MSDKRKRIEYDKILDEKESRKINGQYLRLKKKEHQDENKIKKNKNPKKSKKDDTTSNIGKEVKKSKEVSKKPKTKMCETAIQTEPKIEKSEFKNEVKCTMKSENSIVEIIDKHEKRKRNKEQLLKLVEVKDNSEGKDEESQSLEYKKEVEDKLMSNKGLQQSLGEIEDKIR
jgi:hypothetical protein